MTEVAKAAAQLKNAVGEVRPGESIHYATAGDWSTHDLLLHLIGQIGPAHVTASTWSISEPAVRHLVRALADGRILSLRMLVDWRVGQRSPEALQLARANAARLAMVNCHAKVSVLCNDRWSIAVVGSANYTNNPRIEAGVIAVDEAVAAFHRGWIEAELAGARPFEDRQ